MRTLKTMLAVILVAVMSVLGMGVASADDGGLNNWTNSTRNEAGQGSLPVHSGLTSVAQNKANDMASKEALSGVDASHVPSGYSGLKSFVGKSSSASGAFQKWIADGGKTSMVSASWTHIGSGVATGKSGAVYAVQILATYPPPAPAPAPAPVPAPAPIVVQPAPVIPAPVIPEPVVVQPAPVVEPEPAPVVPAPVVETPKETAQPTVTPTPTPSATVTPSATPTPEVTESAVAMDGAQTGQTDQISKDVVKAGMGIGGVLVLLYSLMEGLRMRKNRKKATVAI